MALWSAALFGHYKPRYYLRSRTTGLTVGAYVERPPEVWDDRTLFLHPVTGWEQRAEPGDIIAVRPYAEHDRWTETERKQFLIVTLDDFEPGQLIGLIEPQWDTDSYPVPDEKQIKALQARGEVAELYPARYIRKRRFHVTLDDLRDRGVDIDRMLNKELFYSPDLDPIPKLKCFDKLNKQYSSQFYGFNLLAPIKIEKVK